MTLKKSWLPILASVSLIVFTIAFYKIRFGIWIRSSHPGPGPTLLRNLEDYFSVIFGYIFDLPGHYLQTPVTVLIVILFLIAGYWAYKNDTYRPSIKRLLDSPFPWEWFLFAGIYSAAMIHLMTKYSIAGTVRFVLPVTQAAMYLTLLLFLKAKIPWVKGLVILFLSALAIGGISSGLDYRSEALAQSPRTQVWDPGIRQTPEFEKLKIAAAEVDAIAWVNHYPASYYKGSALTNLLYCSKIHYFSKEDLGLIAALPQKTLVATDLPIEDLQKWLGPNVKIHGSFAGFRLHFGFLDPKTVSLPYSGPLKEPNLMSRGCPSHRQ